jgi:hypothetical protein
MIESRRTLLTAFAGLPRSSSRLRDLLAMEAFPFSSPIRARRRRTSSASASGSIRHRSQSATYAARWCWSISGPTAATTASTRCPT